MPGSGASTVLNDLTPILTDQIRDGFHEQFERFGGTTGQIFKALKSPTYTVGGEGIEYKFKMAKMHGARPDKSALAGFPEARDYGATKLVVRFHETNRALNDFVSVNATIKTSINDLNKLYMRGMNGEVLAVIDHAEELQTQMAEQFEELTAWMHHLPTTNVSGTVAGSLKQNTADNYEEATAWSGARATARFKVEGGSIAMFQPGTEWVVGTAEIYFKVVHYNPSDSSIGVEVMHDSPNATFSATATTYNGNSIYLRPNDGAPKDGSGMNGLSAWFDDMPVSDSFIGGADRRAPEFQYLRPTIYKPSSSGLAALTKAHLDRAILISQFTKQNIDWSPTVLGGTSLVEGLRNAIGADLVRMEDPKSAAEKAYFGTPALYWFHPTIGRTRFESDPIANPNRLYILVPQTWDLLVYGAGSGKSQPFDWLPGPLSGIWHNVASTTPGGGASKFFAAYGYLVGVCLMCRTPRVNMAIDGVVSPSA